MACLPPNRYNKQTRPQLNLDLSVLLDLHNRVTVNPTHWITSRTEESHFPHGRLAAKLHEKEKISLTQKRAKNRNVYYLRLLRHECQVLCWYQPVKSNNKKWGKLWTSSMGSTNSHILRTTCVVPQAWIRILSDVWSWRRRVWNFLLSSNNGD